jgi:hypothetical protein
MAKNSTKRLMISSDSPLWGVGTVKEGGKVADLEENA